MTNSIKQIGRIDTRVDNCSPAKENYIPISGRVYKYASMLGAASGALGLTAPLMRFAESLGNPNPNLAICGSLGMAMGAAGGLILTKIADSFRYGGYKAREVCRTIDYEKFEDKHNHLLTSTRDIGELIRLEEVAENDDLDIIMVGSVPVVI